MSFLDLLGVQDLVDGTDGGNVALPRRRKVRVLGSSAAVTVVDNDGEKSTDLTVSGGGGGGSGDVVGPASSTDHALARFHSTTGKVIQNSIPTLSDAGILDMKGGNKIVGTNVEALSTAETDASLVLRPNGAGGVAFSTLGTENYAIWSPGVTDAPPIYGTLAAALTAVKAQAGPGVILMHPTTASAFATVPSTTYDFDGRVSLYSINNRTLTFGDSAPIINYVEMASLVDGYTITVDDGGSATGTRLTEVSSNTLRPHIYNVTKSGTDRRLVQFTGGTAAAERGITIGRNVTTAMAGDIYSDGKTAVTLRGHGHSFVAGVVQNSSAHGNNLEVIYEDAQNVPDATMTSSWSTGAASSTYRQDHNHQTNLGTGDPHSQYWLTDGRAGIGITYSGSTDSGAQLTIQSTSHATKGPLVLSGSHVSVNNTRIRNVVNPEVNTDAATKIYVDGRIIKGTVTGLIGNEPTILTGTVTGAAVGDPVAISPDEPGGVANTGLTIQWVRVSATNTVKVCAARSDTSATYTFNVAVMK